MSSAVGNNGPRKAAKVLACVNCQQRKKKCDRRSPCSICIKQNTTCVPSTPAPPRRRRQPTKELLERMARCEELLRQCLEQKAFDKKNQPQQHQAQAQAQAQAQMHHVARPASSSEASGSSKGSPTTSTTTTEGTQACEGHVA